MTFDEDKTSIGETKLTPKEERFCYEYVLYLNAAKAAITAGYAEHTARITGCRLLTKANIQKRIKYLKDNLAETSGISSLRVLKEHEKIAFSDAGQIRSGWMTLRDFESLTDNQKSCIQEVSTKQMKRVSDDGELVVEEWVKLKLYDKQKSLDSINEMLGYNAPTKTEITGRDGRDLITQKSIEERKAELDLLFKQVNGQCN